MDTILEHLTNDHRRCDGFFVAAEEAVAGGDWGQAAAQFDAFSRAMERHFVMEEEVLFPDFERASGSTMGPTQVMRLEHRQMRDLLADMAGAVEGKDADRFLGGSETLLILMQQHNAKEQQILYPMCDDLLAGQREGVIERMDTVEGV